MQIKDNVRRRRQARMKALTDDSLPVTTVQEEPSRIQSYSQPISKNPTPIPYVSTSVHTDPEMAWKEQNRLWRSQLSGDSSHSSNGSDPPANRPTSAWLQSLQVKFALSALIFAAVWGMFQVNLPWTAKVKGFVVSALNEEMNFGAIAVWYDETFHGAPSFIPIFGGTEDNTAKVNTSTVLYPPLQGRITSPYSTALKGVEIEAVAVEPGKPIVVKSMDAGQVIEVTQSDNNRYRIVIQHANELSSVYSGLQAADVKLNDWVQGGQHLGALPADEPTSILYFAIEKGDRFIDPTDVISFD